MKRVVMTTSSSNKRNVKQSASNGDYCISNKDKTTSMMNNNNNNNNSSKVKVLREAKKKKRLTLLKYEELPDYLQDNEFILDYYRSEWPLKDTFLSVFSLHNETLNIWTHLGGFLIFLCLTVMSFMETTTTTTTLQVPTLLFSFSRSVFSPLMMMMMKNSTSNVASEVAAEHGLLGSIFRFNVAAFNSESQIPRWPWFVFLFGAMSCLICSSISHLLACHSRRLNLFFWRLDYAGISVMIVCSFFAPIYYAFLCNPMSRLFYLTTITLVGILVVITLLAPTLSSANYRSFRATLFLTMGFSGVIPATHAVILHWGHHPIYVALGYELAMAVCYAVGVVFYVCRIPERWKPGAFDLAGHSHQIFHVFVVAGALAHCLATLELIEWRLTSPSC